jgi:hypothetical protein
MAAWSPGRACRQTILHRSAPGCVAQPHRAPVGVRDAKGKPLSATANALNDHPPATSRMKAPRSLNCQGSS